MKTVTLREAGMTIILFTWVCTALLAMNENHYGNESKYPKPPQQEQTD